MIEYILGGMLGALLILGLSLNPWIAQRSKFTLLSLENEKLVSEMKSLHLDGDSIEALGRDIPTLLRDLAEWQRKSGEYLAKINEVIDERETWRVLYNDQAAGHDNAQALMLLTISNAAYAYRRDTNGKELKIDPIIKTAHGEWQSKHGVEIREKRGEDGRLRETEDEKSS